MSEAKKTYSVRTKRIPAPCEPAGSYETDLKVETVAAASKAYSAWLFFAGIGMSSVARGSGDVRDEAGKVVAHVSYNGRVWGVDESGRSTNEILFDSRGA